MNILYFAMILAALYGLYRFDRWLTG